MSAQDPTEIARELLEVCAHDLRGALTVITGYVDLLRRRDLDAQAGEQALSGIESAVKRADSLIRDTLGGRTHADGEARRLDLAPLAAAAAADARAFTGREVLMTVVGAPAAGGDEVALARVLENLLSNAAKYAPEGPIDLRVAAEGALAIIEVADRGPGIPAEERERVLEPFARLERDSGEPGTGLGLTVVRSVVEHLNGRVVILEREGGGALVRLELPSAK